MGILTRSAHVRALRRIVRNRHAAEALRSARAENAALREDLAEQRTLAETLVDRTFERCAFLFSSGPDEKSPR